ncbi:MAG: sulfatase [Pirellulales bacterium]
MLYRLTIGIVLSFVLSQTIAAETRPNFVVFFADDMGYSDLGCFGGKEMSTPNIDNLAASGVRLTSFYASQAVCSASRSSLLTGCYNVRIGILGALGPGAKVCLNPEETTIAESLKSVGYSTAIFGKWHLGDRGAGLPLNHGFDQFHGLPYSNDMWPFHPTSKSYPALPLIKNNEVLNPNVTPDEQRNLTRWATENAVQFIQQNRDKPFFLYVPFNMPHVPLFVSKENEGKTGKGLYADVIAEIDSGVGKVVDTLKNEGLSENTLVWFTSDNGPWLSYGNHAGSAGPLREGKGTTWEGGVREPCIVAWPGKIKSGSVSDEVAGTIDILPTLSELARAKLPERKIDGSSIWPILSGAPQARSPHDGYFYYWNRELQAVRSGPWKLHFPHSYRSLKDLAGSDGKPADYVEKKCGLELYNLEQDIGESMNVAEQNPQVVSRLQALADSMRQKLGDSLTSTKGSEARQAGVLP